MFGITDPHLGGVNMHTQKNHYDEELTKISHTLVNESSFFEIVSHMGGYERKRDLQKKRRKGTSGKEYILSNCHSRKQV